MVTLSTDTWDATYTEIPPPSGESLWTADELEDFLKRDPDAIHSVWTAVEGDGGIYLTQGWHYVNRVGYVITEEAITSLDYMSGTAYVWALDSEEAEDG